MNSGGRCMVEHSSMELALHIANLMDHICYIFLKHPHALLIYFYNPYCEGSLIILRI